MGELNLKFEGGMKMYVDRLPERFGFISKLCAQ